MRVAGMAKESVLFQTRGLHQVLIDDQGAPCLHDARVLVVAALGHAHQDVGVSHVRVMDGPVGNDHLSAACSAPGLGTVGLSQSALLMIAETGRLAHNVAGKHNPLASESGDEDFLS